MRANGFLERLKAVFTGTGGTGDRAGRISDRDFAPLGSVEQARDVRQLIDRLEGQDASDVMAGCVQLLGLDQVKERLGPQWGAFADRALLIAQEALDANLEPGDIYRIVDDATFQICFETADEAYANYQ